MRPEKMRVQLACEELVDEVAEFLPHVARRNAHLADHIHRASQSALFNVSEGLAAWNPRQKVYRYEVGRREINEARGGIRVAVRRNHITWAQAKRAYELTGAIAGMLVAAAKAVEEGKGRPPDDEE